MNIDWSKAPEGATHQYPSTGAWYKVEGSSVFFWNRLYNDWRHSDLRHTYVLEGNGFEVRPTAPAWSGEGLDEVSFLKSKLSYNPDTGILTWKPRSEDQFKSSHQYASWVIRCEGKPAGCYVTKRNGKTYIKLEVGGKRYYAHRIAWGIANGEMPDGEIDHINGDSLDNRISNLRVVSRKENCRNTGLHKKSKSGYCGVNWHADTGKWRARVKVDGKEHSLGLFDDVEEAAKAIKQYRDDLGFHVNHGRTPEQIAAEERDRVVREILERGLKNGVSPATMLKEAYEAGYRKDA